MPNELLIIPWVPGPEDEYYTEAEEDDHDDMDAESIVTNTSEFTMVNLGYDPDEDTDVDSDEESVYDESDEEIEAEVPDESEDSDLAEEEARMEKLMATYSKPVNTEMFDYFYRRVQRVVTEGLSNATKPIYVKDEYHKLTPEERALSHSGQRQILGRTMARAKTSLTELIIASIYCERLHDITIHREMYAYDRIGLGALIIANKYVEDRTYSNRSWSTATAYYPRKTINRIEREFIAVMDWNFHVPQEELINRIPVLESLYVLT